MTERSADSPFDWVDYGPPGETVPAPEWDTPPREAGVTRSPPVPDHYVSLSLVGSDVVIYDRTDTSAWIQSSVSVPAAGDDTCVRVSAPETGDRSGE